MLLVILLLIEEITCDGCLRKTAACSEVKKETDVRRSRRSVYAKRIINRFAIILDLLFSPLLFYP